MATTSLEAIRRITMEAREKGFDEVAAKLDKITKAQEGVAASATTVEKSSGSTEQAFKKVERQLDSNVVAYQKYASSIKAVADAQAQGLVTQQRSADLFSLAETRLRKTTGTLDKVGDATGPARHEMQNFMAQVQDIGVSLVGGQSPFLVMAQQVPQLTSVVAASNSSLKDFALSAVAGAGRILAAWGPLIGAVAAVGAGVAASMKVTEREREQRIATTGGPGRLLGASGPDLEAAAQRSQQPGMSIGESRSGIEAFTRAGVDSLAVIEKLNAATVQYAASTKSELAPATERLAGIFGDLSKGIDTLDKELDLRLGKSTKDLIRNLEATGDKVGAAKVAIEAMAGALVKPADATNTWRESMARLSSDLDALIEKLGRLGPALTAGIPKPQIPNIGGAFAGVEAPQALGPPQPGIPNIGVGFGGPPAGATAGDQPFADPAAAEASEAATKAATAAVVAYEAEMVKAGSAANETMSAIQNSAQAFELQKNVMMATTVETRAAATEAQALNQATGGLTATLQQEAAARQAGEMVRAQSAATQAQLIAGQQAELAMGQQLIAAAGAQGAAGVALRAGLQEELSLRQQGIDVTTRHSQTLIENAGALAKLNLKMQDTAQAAQLTQSIQGQIQMLQLETQMIGANATERARAISLLQSEIQARALEAQGFDKSAKAVRQYASALAEAKAQQAQAQATHAAAQADTGPSAGDTYRVEFHNQQAQMLREMDMLSTQISVVGASAGDAAYALKQQELENAALATTSDGAADAIEKNRDALASMTAQLADATAAEQKRKQALQEEESSVRSNAAAVDAANKKGARQPLSERGGFTSTAPLTWLDYQERARKQNEKAGDVQKQAAEAERAGQQRQLTIASSTIQDQISALQDQKSAIGEQTSALDDQTQAMEDNTNALEKETSKRREQLDKQIAKLEKALTPSRPDPYAERNPDYFYRFGTEAFKENDPNQALLAAAEAERDGLDKQLDAQKEAVEQQKQQVEQQKKAVELQQKAIDEQIKGYEAQASQLDRAGNLLSSGVELSAQEVSGLQAILAAIGALGDYARLQQANVQTTLTAQQTAAKSAGDPASEFANTYEYAIERMRRGAAYQPITPPTYGFQQGVKGFSGFFASGGYIPPGSWGVAGESGPEVISRKRAVAGPATVTPISSGNRPIVVNQTFVSQAGAKDLRSSRGEIAQRSSSEMRRSLGAR